MKLLIDKKGRKYLIDGEEFHSSLGVVKLGEARAGDVVKSHLGHEFYVLEPRFIDLYEKLPRASSIILKKDLGAIAAHCGLGSGMRVLDAGLGSGAATMFFANIVKPHGKVYAYEIRENFAEVAKRNIALAGLAECVEVKLKDVRSGIDERELDLVCFDLPDPWLAIPHAHAALKHGAFIAVYNPYVGQVEKSVAAMREAGFKSLKTIELLEREMEVKDIGTRPRTSMISHTAYLTFGRKY